MYRVSSARTFLTSVSRSTRESVFRLVSGSSPASGAASLTCFEKGGGESVDNGDRAASAPSSALPWWMAFMTLPTCTEDSLAAASFTSTSSNPGGTARHGNMGEEEGGSAGVLSSDGGPTAGWAMRGRPAWAPPSPEIPNDSASLTIIVGRRLTPRRQLSRLLHRRLHRDLVRAPCQDTACEAHGRSEVRVTSIPASILGKDANQA